MSGMNTQCVCAYLNTTTDAFHQLLLRERLEAAVDDGLMQLCLHFEVLRPDTCTRPSASGEGSREHNTRLHCLQPECDSEPDFLRQTGLSYCKMEDMEIMESVIICTR